MYSVHFTNHKSKSLHQFQASNFQVSNGVKNPKIVHNPYFEFSSYAYRAMKNIVSFVLLVISVYAIPQTIDGARIIAIFPTLARSHFIFHESIMKSLLDAGHRVTFFAPFPTTIRNRTNFNLTMIDSRLVKSENRSPCVRNFKSTFWLKGMYDTNVIYEKNCHDLVKLPEMQTIPKSRREYDLMFVAVNQMYECYLPIAKILDIPVIATSTFRWMLNADSQVGNPRNPAAIPFEFSYAPKEMNFRHRLVNVFDQLAVALFYRFVEIPSLSVFYNEHFPNFENLDENKRISLLFSNSHHSLFARPTTPNSIDIGGIHISPNVDPLPENIAKFIDEAKHGVILITFGSITEGKVISPELKKIFIDTFAELPQRVIWKFESHIDNLPENVLLSPWPPQRDILAHANVKAFVTHCGLLGIEEAIYEAKPMVLIPFFVDQPANAALLNDNVGIYLDFRTLTKDKLLQAINTIINDKKYSDNVRRLSNIFKDRPMSPQESVVYWTEYVLHHTGAEHLQTNAIDIPWYQYFLLDVLAFLGLICSMVVIALHRIVKVLRYLSIRKPVIKEKKIL